MRALINACLAALVLLGAGCKKPEDVLAKHMTELTERLEEADSPGQAIEDGRRYMQENLPEIARASAELTVELDEIEARSERKGRLKAILQTLNEPATDLIKVVAKLSEKANDDESAKEAAKSFQKQWQGIAEQLMADALGKELNKAKIEISRVVTERVARAVVLYQVAHDGKLPRSLDDLVQSSYLRANSLKDGWGRALHLEREDGDESRFKVCSPGQDAVPGTEDDLCSGEPE